MGYTGGMRTPITILAIADSLRAASLNTALLQAIVLPQRNMSSASIGDSANDPCSIPTACRLWRPCV